MKTKYIGAAIAAFGFAQMFVLPVPNSTPSFSGYQFLTDSNLSGGGAHGIMDLATLEGGMFWLDLAMIAGGAYLFFKK